jgi:hypothetical protein
MQSLLKQSTAVTVTILMVDSITHYAGVTGLSAGLTIYATKAGGTPTHITPTVSELDATNAPGLYSLALTSSHTNTLGELQLYITGSGADPARYWYQVGPTPADLEVWLGSVPNALISGRVDSNAQVVEDKVDYTLTNGEHIQVATDVLDAVAADHNAAGTIGADIGAVSAVGDPWNVALPGSYVAGKAGFIVGTNLDAIVSTIKMQTDKMQFDGSNNIEAVAGADSPGVTTLLGRLTATRAAYLDLINTYLNVAISAVKAVVDAIKTKTDQLPSDPVSESSVETAITTAQGVITAQTDLIKAKTVNLPNSPAATGAKMDIVDSPNSTAVTAIQSGLATSANQTTILARLGAWTGSGRNTILGALQSLFRSDADPTTPTDINANLGNGAGTYDNTTDSLEAIRDRGDASWGGGGNVPTAAQNADAVWDALRADHVISASFGQGIASVQGNITGTVASVVGNVGGNVAGNVNGNVAGYVGSVAGNVSGTVPDSTGITTLLARLSATRAGYLDILAGWTGTLLNALKAMSRKDATASTDIGGTHDPATDSEEALSEMLATVTPGGATTENVTVNELPT